MTEKVLIVGDFHISDRYNGKHKNYLENCFECLDMIEKTIVEKQITHLVCLGDWVGIGLAEKNLKERGTLLKVIQVLQRWNKLTNGHVYSLRGNHDIGKTMTDYDFFVSIGLLKNPDHFDVGSCRFHLFNYGEETRAVAFAKDKDNIGCFHTNLLIEGLTTWYRGGVGVELSSLKNLRGLIYAVAGHIHTPSLRLVQTSIEGEAISLFYPGCLMRPRLEPNMWDSAYGIIFEDYGEELPLNVQFETYQLKPFTEVFDVDAPDEEEEEEGDVAPFDLEELSKVLKEVSMYNLNSGQDYVTQIKRFAGLDTEARDIALNYLEDAEATFV